MNQPTLHSVQHGDKSAFAAVVQHYQTPLFAYLGRMGIQQAIAEELIQETFIRAWQARERFDGTQSAYSTWLFTIARRLTLNELDRAARRHEQTAGDGTASATIESHPTAAASPPEHLENQQMQTLLNQALQQLPPHERSLLALAYIQELGFSDIARIEGIPVGTVKSRLHRIRGTLK
ncbi:MAG: RNA polymerase sigma factor, partial [uncultured Thiotrichaceae bacterium]